MRENLNDNTQCCIQISLGQNMMALAFLQHLWQHCNWLHICPQISTQLSFEFLTFLDTSQSSLQTACPRSLYRLFKLDHGFTVLCFKSIQSQLSLNSLSQQRRPNGESVSLSNYQIDWLLCKDFSPPLLHISFSPLGESDQQILPNQQES